MRKEINLLWFTVCLIALHESIVFVEAKQIGHFSISLVILWLSLFGFAISDKKRRDGL